MKKLIIVAVIIAMLMLVSCTPEFTAEGTLTIGVPSLDGSFFDGCCENQNDDSVLELISGGCALYARTTGGQLILNPSVVEHYTAELDAANNKTYIFTIKDDLLWSDGSPITAKDYVFAVLFLASNEWSLTGAGSNIGKGLLGYDSYQNGETDRFAGVKLISETEFSLTIDSAMFPSYYIYDYMTVNPLCLASLMPAGSDVDSNELGASLVVSDLVAAAQRVYNEERVKPTVTCGAYKFDSFTEGVCTLSANEHYAGDVEGLMPTIATIRVVSLGGGNAVDSLIAGDIDICFGITDDNDLTKAEDAGLQLLFYSRNGYSAVAFHCDWGAAADVNVRQAVARIIDRKEVIEYAFASRALAPDSEYCLSAWMCLSGVTASLPKLNLDLVAANRYLDSTEWVFEKDGKTAFDSTKAKADGSYLRYNADKQALTLYHLGTSNNTVTDALEIQFNKNAPLVGMKIIVERSDYTNLLSHLNYGYELGGARKYNSFNIGFNIPSNYNPYLTLHSDWLNSRNNINQLSDTEIDSLSLALQAVNAGDSEAYLAAWFAYQERFNELLPNIPLGSDNIYTVCSQRVMTIAGSPLADWAENICRIKLVTETAE